MDRVALVGTPMSKGGKEARCKADDDWGKKRGKSDSKGG